MSSYLSYQLIPSLSSATPKTAVLFHGILGSKKNWNSFIQKLAAATPHWQFLSVDLRNHGDSHGFKGPHDLNACARDVAKLLEYLNIVPQKVIGHSFGGKVALAYAQLIGNTLPNAWILDCLPGPLSLHHPLNNNISILHLIDILKSVHLPIHSRRSLIEILEKSGVNHHIALWMTTNLISKDEGLYWNFNPLLIEEMISHYAVTDFFPFLKSDSRTTQLDFVRAEYNQRWEPSVIKELSNFSSSQKLHLHLLEKSDHWVHVDNPSGLLQLLEPSFQTN